MNERFGSTQPVASARWLARMPAVWACVAAAAIAAPSAYAAAEVIPFFVDPAGSGYNDATPAAPVAGNSGTTLGAQRRIVMERAAAIWGQALDSAVPITVLTGYAELRCTSTNFTIASTSVQSVYRNFPGAPLRNTWYPRALAERILGDFLGPVETLDDLGLRVAVNSRIGQAGCGDGASVYLGLDGNAPPGAVNLLSTFVHEIAHGLGFSTETNQSTGAYFQGFPTAYDHQVFDNTLGRSWTQMTAAERAASAVNVRNVVWRGPRVTTDLRQVLERGLPELRAIGQGLAGFNPPLGFSTFGPQLTSFSLYSANSARLVDRANGTGLACTPLSAANTAQVRGRIVVIDRGECSFVTKVKNAQTAGAVAVVLADNQPTMPPFDPTDTDASITIPSVLVGQADGAVLKGAISSAAFNPIVTLRTNTARRWGTDRSGFALLYTPSVVSNGSSVTHFDLQAKPNLLMEPSASGLDTDAIVPSLPRDLTRSLLADIGW